MSVHQDAAAFFQVAAVRPSPLNQVYERSLLLILPFRGEGVEDNLKNFVSHFVAWVPFFEQPVELLLGSGEPP